MTGTATKPSSAKLDPKLKDDAIEQKESYAHCPQFSVQKMPPYTPQEIDQMLEMVASEDILCTNPTCYSVTGSGGTACGSCCS